MGSRHDETGLLRWDRGTLILQRDGGGRWRLETGRRAETMVGRRVRIVGTRVGFDLLAVSKIEPC